ncbi:MAG: hypothetical protein ACT4QE_00735 [Anaerolineales bacterium]
MKLKWIEVEVFCAAVVWLIWQNVSSTNRENYGAIDEKVLMLAENWNGNDPEELALLVAGYPNHDGISPASISKFESSLEEPVFVILSRDAMDDSILREETRVDLKVTDGIWVVEWAGQNVNAGAGSSGVGRRVPVVEQAS